jgi:hypothetical protein
MKICDFEVSRTSNDEKWKDNFAVVEAGGRFYMGLFQGDAGPFVRNGLKAGAADLTGNAVCSVVLWAPYRIVDEALPSLTQMGELSNVRPLHFAVPVLAMGSPEFMVFYPSAIIPYFAMGEKMQRALATEYLDLVDPSQLAKV